MTPLRLPDQSIQQQAELEKAFEELAAQWRTDTAFMSSVSKMATHPAYQQIIEMGPAVVPLILRELQREPDHWFWALTAITGEDPIQPEDAGDVDKMTQSWLALGRERGYV